MDMADNEIVLTQESPSEPAVAFASRGIFYGWYHKEAAAQFTQATTIDFSGNRERMLHLHLAHPSHPIAAIKDSIIAVAQHFPHIRSLATMPQIVEMAATRVANPQHSY
jgi:hypothetical protein